MDGRVYNLLLSYGFTPLDIDDIEIDNSDIYNKSYEYLAGNLKFLKKRRIDNDSIVKIINNNPSIITGDIKKYKLIRNFFESTLSFSNEEFGLLIKNNNNILTNNINDMKNIIDYFIAKGINKNELKNKLLSNSGFLNYNVNVFSI